MEKEEKFERWITHPNPDVRTRESEALQKLFDNAKAAECEACAKLAEEISRQGK
jgi:hypothetical protein